MANKDRSKYEENAQSEFSKYAKDMLQEQKTLVDQDPNFYYYWERENEVRLRLREGYEVVQNKDGEMSLYAEKSQDPTNNSSCYRLPTQDSSEDLILLQIPMELHKAREAKRQAQNDYLESQVTRSDSWQDKNGSWETKANKTITNK